MKRKILSLPYLMILTLIVLAGSVTVAKADMGPKPSVHIRFEDLPAGEIYAAILTKDQTFSIYKPDGIPTDILERFNHYADPDGYALNGLLKKVTSGGPLSWSYMAPQTFKILLYSEEQDRFYVSPVQERYAFKSTYTARPENGALTVGQDLGKGGLVLGFFARLAVTVLIEVLIAVGFGLKTKRQLGIILLTNVITQLILNLLLSFVFGMPTVFFFYAISFGICELIVFAVEAVVYTLHLKDEQCSNKILILYAFVANLVSMILGFFFSNQFPTLF